MRRLNTLSKRLSFILDSRRPNPWGAEIGLSSNMITRMGRDEIPGIEALLSIQLQEYVSIDWLIEGRGQPFLTRFYFNEDDLCTQVLRQAHQNRDRRLTLLTDLQLVCFVFQSYEHYDYQKRRYKYFNIDIIAGYFSYTAFKLYETLTHYSHVNTIYFTHDKMQELANGWLGTFKLFGNDRETGLIEHYQVSYPNFKLTPLKLSLPNSIETLTFKPYVNLDNELLNEHLIASIYQYAIGPLLHEENVSLSNDQLATVVCALYRYCIRSNTTPQNIDTYTLLLILETLNITI